MDAVRGGVSGVSGVKARNGAKLGRPFAVANGPNSDTLGGLFIDGFNQEIVPAIKLKEIRPSLGSWSVKR